MHPLERAALWLTLFFFAVLCMCSHYQQKEALKLICKWNLRQMEKIDRLYADNKEFGIEED